MYNFLNSLAFNATMIFLMIGGLVNSIVAVSTTKLIGAYGILGNVLGIAYFGYGAYKAWKNNL
jgi:uncharacterized membrane protein YebE (DUF533 family)